MAKEMGLGVCPYSPLAGGLLTGKYASPEASGRLKANPAYKVRYGEERHHATAAALTSLARELGHHPASLAVAWVASHPAVTAPILGARNLAQLQPSLDAATLTMTPELRQRLSALSPSPPPANDRSEETQPAQ
jgi:aryl-alcohol dehydrogenase-like predicted oxidoreductase